MIQESGSIPQIREEHHWAKPKKVFKDKEGAFKKKKKQTIRKKQIY